MLFRSPLRYPPTYSPHWSPPPSHPPPSPRSSQPTPAKHHRPHAATSRPLQFVTSLYASRPLYRQVPFYRARPLLYVTSPFSCTSPLSVSSHGIRLVPFTCSIPFIGHVRFIVTSPFITRPPQRPPKTHSSGPQCCRRRGRRARCWVLMSDGCSHGFFASEYLWTERILRQRVTLLLAWQCCRRRGRPRGGGSNAA